MLKILIATNNPIKVEAVSNAFVKYFQDSFEIESIKHSPTSFQVPTTSYQTLEAAILRTKNAKKERDDFHYYIGIETGIEYIDNDLLSYVWVAILHNQKIGKAKSMTYVLPLQIKTAFEKGDELASIIEKTYGKDTLDKNDGMLAHLTKGEIYRKKLFEETIILAISNLEY